VSQRLGTILEKVTCFHRLSRPCFLIHGGSEFWTSRGAIDDGRETYGACQNLTRPVAAPSGSSHIHQCWRPSRVRICAPVRLATSKNKLRRHVRIFGCMDQQRAGLATVSKTPTITALKTFAAWRLSFCESENRRDQDRDSRRRHMTRSAPRSRSAAWATRTQPTSAASA